MQIFIDSANISEIKKWLNYGVVDGVTTNPSVMFKDGVYDVEAGAKEIAALVNSRPVSVEVTTNDPQEMVTQARIFAKWAPNIVIKIPIINQDGIPCLGVIKTLAEEGIKINVTAIMSFGQVVLAAKAGATYASIFSGRVADEGHDAPKLIHEAVEWLERWGYKTRIIVGSIRGVIDIQNAAVAAADIITIPPQFLAKMADHKYTRETVRQFVADASRALVEIERARVAELVVIRQRFVPGDRIFQDLVERLTHSLKVTVSSLAVLDEQEGLLTIYVVNSVRYLANAPPVGCRISLGHAPTYLQVTQDGQPVLFRQDVPALTIPSQELELTLTSGLKSGALLPVKVNGRVVGVVSLGEMRRWERSPFTEEKLSQGLSLVAQWAQALSDWPPTASGLPPTDQESKREI